MEPQDRTPGDHLTEGWPDDPANADLAAFAREFRHARPSLSKPAMDRISRAFRSELHAPTPVRTPFFTYRRWAAAAAAGVVLAAGAWAAWEWQAGQDRLTVVTSGGNAGQIGGPATSGSPVRDTYLVSTAAVPRLAAPERPLVPLAEYGGLVNPNPTVSPPVQLSRSSHESDAPPTVRPPRGG